MARVIDFRYRQYIASDEWRARRRERLEIDGHMCTNCDSTSSLEVHHLTYERLGNEPMGDLTTLCSTCHGRLHGRGPKILPVAGTKTPRQQQEEAAERRYHRLLGSAEGLNQACEAFTTAAGAMLSKHHEELLVSLRWIAGDILADVQRRVEWEEQLRSRRRRRRRAAA